MKDIDFILPEKGILTEIAMPMIGWSDQPEDSTFHITHLYFVYSTTSMASKVKKPDGSTQMTLDASKTKQVFKDLTDYVKDLGIHYGLLMRMDYSLLFTSGELETDPLYFKLASGWNILDAMSSEEQTPELQNLIEAANIDIITINRYLDDLRK